MVRLQPEVLPWWIDYHEFEECVEIKNSLTFFYTEVANVKQYKNEYFKIKLESISQVAQPNI